MFQLSVNCFHLVAFLFFPLCKIVQLVQNSLHVFETLIKNHNQLKEKVGCNLKAPDIFLNFIKIIFLGSSTDYG